MQTARKLILRAAAAACAFLPLALVPVHGGCNSGRRITVEGSCRPLNDLTDAEILSIVLSRLSQHCQPDGPVGVVMDPGLDERGLRGMTERCGPGYLIHLSTSEHGEGLFDVLVHEWAHALAFPDEVAGEDPLDCGGHGAQWGIELSRTFRAGMYNIGTPDARAVPPTNCEDPTPDTPEPDQGEK